MPHAIWAWLLITAELALAATACSSLLWARPLTSGTAAALPKEDQFSGGGLGWPEALMQQGQTARAVPLLESLLVHEGESAVAWNDLCTAHLGLREYGAAEAACLRGLQLDSKLASLREHLARVQHYQQLRRWTGLRLQEVPLGKRNADFYLEEGRYRMGDDDGAAVQAFQKASTLNNRNAEAETELGIALMRTKQYQEAEAAFARAVALEPDNRLAYEDYAWSVEAENGLQ